MISSSIWHEAAQTSTIHKKSLSAGPGQVLVKARSSLVSSGTERLVARGQVPKSLWDEMAVPYQQGNFGFPIKYGYSLVGEIAQDKHPHKGQLVHLLHPHQDLLYAKESDLYWVPSGIPASRASLASNLETALNAVWDAQVMPGDRVLVVGFGLIGSLVARLLSLMPATELRVVELDVDRQAMAREMGFDVSTSLLQNEQESFDCAFHSSVSSAGLQSAIDAVGREGKVVELSWYGEKNINLNLGGRFHSQRKRIISSQVSRLPETHQARWDFSRRKEVVFRLLANPLFDQHLGKEIPFPQAPDLFDQLRKNEARALSYWISY